MIATMQQSQKEITTEMLQSLQQNERRKETRCCCAHGGGSSRVVPYFKLNHALVLFNKILSIKATSNKFCCNHLWASFKTKKNKIR